MKTEADPLRQYAKRRVGDTEIRVPPPKASAKAVGMFKRGEHDSFFWGFWEKGLRKAMAF